jgi:hypothetical protein
MEEFIGALKWGLWYYPTPNKNLKTNYFVSTMILNVLRDLVFSRNQQLKSAGHQQIWSSAETSN